MAENSSDRIGWLLQLNRQDGDWLGDIRHWQHLRVATVEGSIWVSGFSEEEITSLPVRTIPGKQIWQQRGPLLFPQGSRVPSRKAPEVLWTAISSGLPVTLPPFNHNYFGVQEQIPIRLVPSTEEQTAAAMYVSLEVLGQYIHDAPAVRLKPIRWTLLPGARALLVGTPLLPLPGQACWGDGPFLVPAGYRFEFPAIIPALKARLQGDEPAFVCWQPDGSYSRIPEKQFAPLSIGSFRQSTAHTNTKDRA